MPRGLGAWAAGADNPCFLSLSFSFPPSFSIQFQSHYWHMAPRTPCQSSCAKSQRAGEGSAGSNSAIYCSFGLSLTPGPHHVATAFPGTPQLPASAGSQCCSYLDHCPEGMTVLGTGHTALNVHGMCSTGAQEDLGGRSGRGLNTLTISYNLLQQLKVQPGDFRVKR